MSDQRSTKTERFPTYETVRDEKGHLRTKDGRRVLTPRLPDGRRVEVALSEKEERAFEHAWQFTIASRVQLPDGVGATLRRADCGLGCYCDALVVPDLAEVGSAEHAFAQSHGDVRPCATCGKPGHRPQDHAGWDPREDGHG